ncbi:MAG: TerB family tellurite resistance protein, partial [Thioalkalispiraceae bacterium]
MLKTIKQFFEQNISPEMQVDDEHRLKLATAALLIEMMKQDGKAKDEELEAVGKALQTKFSLTETETHELIELASEEARQAVDFYQFTSLIHKHFPAEKKIKIIEYLWMIAFADKHLDAHEEHL